MAWGMVVKTGAMAVQYAHRTRRGRVRPLTRTSSMIAELAAIANTMVRTASNVALTVYTDSEASIKAITSFHECTSHRKRTRSSGWVLLNLITIMRTNRTADFRMEHVRAHVGHAWNEKAHLIDDS
jgi:ribonuclease HI